ncbi:hypothetical protein Taro_018204, partial [Colocasia esculenta]|nr:hypothetical protein [Colocasia esculenta]
TGPEIRERNQKVGKRTGGRERERLEERETRKDMAPSSSPTSGAGGRSSQLRRDDVFGRWIIFSPARARRPSEFKSSTPANGAKPDPSRSNEAPFRPPPPSCPFCFGNEHQCAPEIFRFPAGAAEWQLRVIENLYPALRREEEPPASDLDCRERERGLVVAGYGFHDVVIETPYHGFHLSDLSPTEAGEVVLAYRERVLQLASLGSIKFLRIMVRQLEHQ